MTNTRIRGYGQAVNYSVIGTMKDFGVHDDLPHSPFYMHKYIKCVFDLYSYQNESDTLLSLPEAILHCV